MPIYWKGLSAGLLLVLFILVPSQLYMSYYDVQDTMSNSIQSESIEKGNFRNGLSVPDIALFSTLLPVPPKKVVQSTHVISTSVISNNRLSRKENLTLVS